MGTMASAIVPGAKLGLMATEKLMTGVTPENYGRFAQPGGTVVRSNHPAFVLGHLSLYPQRIMRHLDQPPGPTAVPSSYEALFKAGVECQDDPQGNVYPPLEELSRCFFDGYRAAIEAVGAAGDEVFSAANPVEGRLRELFPTIGAAITFYLIGHVQVHLGQVSAWRRAMGLPPA